MVRRSYFSPTASAFRVCGALGHILGPALAGIAADRAGISIAFDLAAGVIALNLIMTPPRALHSAPLASR